MGNCHNGAGCWPRVADSCRPFGAPEVVLGKHSALRCLPHFCPRKHEEDGAGGEIMQGEYQLIASIVGKCCPV